MAKGKRKVPDINSSSTADIAFLLLIFFLITTSMDTDRGLARRLPPPPEQNQNTDDIKLKERNVLQVFLNMNDQLMCGNDYITTDQLRAKAKEFIALTMFKDFFTGLYQITIMFNYPATLVVDGFDIPSVIELAYLLYEGDYRKVIADAEDILRDYKEDYTFNPEKTRAIDYHIEGCVGKTLPPEVHEEYLSGKHGHTVCYFTRRAS